MPGLSTRWRTDGGFENRASLVTGHRRLSHVFWIDGVVTSHIIFVALLAVYETLPAAAFLAGAQLFLG